MKTTDRLLILLIKLLIRFLDKHFNTAGFSVQYGHELEKICDDDWYQVDE